MALVKAGDEGFHGLYMLACQYCTCWPCPFASTSCVAVRLASFSKDYAVLYDEALGRRTHHSQPTKLSSSAGLPL